MKNLASIQPRTSSPKFAEASKRYPPLVINLALSTHMVVCQEEIPDIAEMEYDNAGGAEKAQQHIANGEHVHVDAKWVHNCEELRCRFSWRLCLS